MNRNSYDNFSVPSLSLASSRSKRNIPTKDTNKPPTIDISHKLSINRPSQRQSRPPIFSSKNNIEIEKKGVYVPQPKQQDVSLNRNVYLNREQNIQMNDIPTFRGSQVSRAPSRERLLRNPENGRQFVNEVRTQMQVKKIDAKKSLFQRKMQKLFQEAQFYENQMLSVYSENNQLLDNVSSLYSMKEDALSLRDIEITN